MTRNTTIILILCSVFILGGWDCGDPILDDPSFDLWCGKVLCAWKVDPGSVQRVATWHRSDYGVELVGDPVALSQLSTLKRTSSTCFDIELNAQYEEHVSLTLEMDFLDDGKPEWSAPITSNRFVPVRFSVRSPQWFSGVRFVVRKRGKGKAVLGHIRVLNTSSCANPPLALPNRPNGSRCAVGSECSSNRCSKVLQWPDAMADGHPSVCNSCEKSSDCASSQACGLEASGALLLHLACGKAGRHGLGERCAFDDECQGGVCCEGVCSQCCSHKQCGSGRGCEKRDPKRHGDGYQYQMLPWQCDPHEGAAATGEVCLTDSDCKSGACQGNGTLKVCWLDGRLCQKESDCPSWPKCLELGQAGGTCR